MHAICHVHILITYVIAFTKSNTPGFSLISIFGNQFKYVKFNHNTTWWQHICIMVRSTLQALFLKYNSSRMLKRQNLTWIPHTLCMNFGKRERSNLLVIVSSGHKPNLVPDYGIFAFQFHVHWFLLRKLWVFNFSFDIPLSAALKSLI